MHSRESRMQYRGGMLRRLRQRLNRDALVLMRSAASRSLRVST